MFDLGLEDNGDSMGFSRKEWDFAFERLISLAGDVGADCKVLMTRNVEGSEVEVGPREGGKDTSCSGKLMVRRRPKNVDDVIETRIAVVGNGMWFTMEGAGHILTDHSRCWEIHSSWSTGQRRSRRWTRKGSSQSLQTQT
jgi:hypothetical protein